MIAVLQRIKKGSVTVEGRQISSCAEGLCVLLGVGVGDSEVDADALARKIVNLRIFSDENDKMNLSVQDVGGEALVVSNFTLLANYAHGNRPDYFNAAPPMEANRLYEYFVELLSARVKHVACGVFGADMQISMVADGPITIVMDSAVLSKKQK